MSLLRPDVIKQHKPNLIYLFIYFIFYLFYFFLGGGSCIHRLTYLAMQFAINI